MKIRMLTILAIFTIFSTIAIAGYIQPAITIVDLDAKLASGDMWTARSSDNEVEFIGCGIRHFDDGAGGVYTWGFCQARDAGENEILCYTENPELLAALSTINDYSFVTFSWREDPYYGQECIRVGYSTQSFYLPLFKIK